MPKKQPLLVDASLSLWYTLVMTTERIVKTSRGYLQKIWNDEDGQLHREYVHRLVWIEHNGPIPPGHHVHHKDGDKTNNAIDNLELKKASDHTTDHNETDSRPPWKWKKKT